MRGVSGASKSPEVFHRLTQAVTRMMARREFRTILAYLDDFLIIGDTKHECELAYYELILNFRPNLVLA